MVLKLSIDSNKCTGCRMCLLLCSAEHAGVYSQEKAKLRIRCHEEEGRYLPTVCIQCAEHPCVDACPTDALVFDDKLSIFLVDQENCNACGLCRKNCPHDGIYVQKKQVARKCNLCNGDPACVYGCTTGALTFEEEVVD